MAHLLKMTILRAAADDSTADVEFMMDGNLLGTETVPTLALAALTGDWAEAGELVGMSFEREVE